MPSGGARSRSGPAPDRNAIRNGRAGADWIRLPSAGRKGEAPAWPLSRPTKRELVLWAIEWARPQALMWEANGQQVEVALYVRSLRETERTGSSVASRTLIVRQQDALGLNQPGLARNHWIIDTGVAEDLAEKEATPRAGTSDARARMRLVVNRAS
jgi:hypothetical protein